MADISAIKLNNTTYILKDASSARTIDLSIDTTTYVLTATLKDASGTVISTSTGIDLPLETMVVGGEYVSDDPTYGNAIKLELKNGTYVTFPIGGLISGLQSEITANSKLSSDLVDDTNKINRFVTADEKTAWDAKSDFSGSYIDLTDKPTIPAAQVNSDWTATSGVAQILNKPTLATVATSGSYNDLSDKPTIPEGVVVDQVYDATSTNAQSGVAVAQAIAKKPGEITTGKRYTIDDETVIAGTGAEAFNDLANNKAVAPYSHAEGTGTTASGTNCHAEGAATKASGAQSHAEGSSTTASGDISHAEGNGTTASGDISHAEGSGTKASSNNQHVQGKYNVEDANGKFAFIIGNGTSDNTRHDAFAVDWDGLIYVNGASTGVDVSAFPSPADINTAITKSNAAAPQSTTYTKTEVNTALAAKLNTSDVDAALSSTSTNPVQNKVVQAPVARLVDAGAKNLYIITNSSEQYLGVTFTVNDNGTVSVTGTATTSNSVYRPGNWTCPKSGTYIVSGCPAGGSWAPNTNKYRIRIAVNGSWKGDDVGSKISLSLSAGDVIELQINTSAGYEVSNLIFKPMICTAEDHAISPEFVPYAKSNYELTQVTEPIPRLVDAGVKNLLVIRDQTATSRGITAVVKDGILTTSGTATGGAITLSSKLLPPGEYVCSGCPANGSDTTYRLLLLTSTDGTSYSLDDNMIDYGSGFAFTLSTQMYVRPALWFKTGYVASNLIFKPMVCTAEDYAISPEFVPYAMSNADLTDSILNKQDVLLYTNRANATTYSFNGLTNIDSNLFKYGILIGGGSSNNAGKVMIWHVFVNTTGTVFFTKIIGDDTMTLTGSISDGVLTITSSATIYGGIRLIWLG